jgi:hypothetical protein
MLDDYEEALQENDLKFIKRRAQELADTYKLSLGPEEFAVWSREVLKAEIKLLAIMRQRERGDYAFERQVLNPPVTVAHVSNSKDTDTPSPQLSEVIDAYVKEMLQVGKWRLKLEDFRISNRYSSTCVSGASPFDFVSNDLNRVGGISRRFIKTNRILWIALPHDVLTPRCN